MSGLTKQDWETLNAYHDGELAPAASREFEVRFAREPDLAAALASVSGLSADLSVLRSELVGSQQNFTRVEPKPANCARTFRTRLAGGALAASLLGAAVLCSWLLTAQTPFDVHRDLAAQPFAVGSSDFDTVASSTFGWLPDLQGAGLVPVTERNFGQGRIAHYAGRSGCRLSYFRSEGTKFSRSTDDGQIAVWTTADGFRHGIIATGMDTEKFSAVSDYLRAVTAREANEDLYAALEATTAAAAPCVG